MKYRIHVSVAITRVCVCVCVFKLVSILNQMHKTLKIIGFSFKILNMGVHDPGIKPELFVLARVLIQQLDNLEISDYGPNEHGLSKKRGSVLVFLPGTCSLLPRISCDLLILLILFM